MLRFIRPSTHWLSHQFATYIPFGVCLILSYHQIKFSLINISHTSSFSYLTSPSPHLAFPSHHFPFNLYSPHLIWYSAHIISPLTYNPLTSFYLSLTSLSFNLQSSYIPHVSFHSVTCQINSSTYIPLGFHLNLSDP